MISNQPPLKTSTTKQVNEFCSCPVAHIKTVVQTGRIGMYFSKPSGDYLEKKGGRKDSSFSQPVWLGTTQKGTYQVTFSQSLSQLF